MACGRMAALESLDAGWKFWQWITGLAVFFILVIFLVCLFGLSFGKKKMRCILLEVDERELTELTVRIPRAGRDQIIPIKFQNDYLLRSLNPREFIDRHVVIEYHKDQPAKEMWLIGIYLDKHFSN